MFILISNFSNLAFNVSILKEFFIIKSEVVEGNVKNIFKFLKFSLLINHTFNYNNVLYY